MIKISLFSRTLSAISAGVACGTMLVALPGPAHASGANPIPMMAAPAAVDPAAVPAEQPAPTAAVPAPTDVPPAVVASPAPVAAPVPAVAAPAPTEVTTPAPSEQALNDASVPSLLDSLGASMPTAPMPGMDLPVDGMEAVPALTPEQEAEQMRREAYEAMMSGLLPLGPDELRESFTRVDRNQKAIEEPLKFPKPEVAFTTVSIDPGATPLTFKLATGHVTTVTFLDITGAPWPIKDVSWAGNFEIKAPTDGNSRSDAHGEENQTPDEALKEMKEIMASVPNVMRIMPLGDHAYGNMSVRLAGLVTPVTFTLRTNQDVVQYRLDIRIPEEGPLATPSLIAGSSQTGLTAGDATLTRVMEGVLPNSANKMNVSGVDGRTSVYLVDGMMYVRTPLTLLSPGWSASVKSADGTNVYAINNAPVLLLSDNGQMVRAQITETKGE